MANDSMTFSVNSNGAPNITIKNTSTTKSVTCTYTQSGQTITINNVSNIALEGPDEWHLYVNNELFADLVVEHHKNTANDNKVLTQNMLLELIYPIGSIYTSTKNVNPANLFGGTWTAIVDKFMYCVDPTNAQSKQTGGSKTITVNNLPAHNHRGEMLYDDDHTLTNAAIASGGSYQGIIAISRIDNSGISIGGDDPYIHGNPITPTSQGGGQDYMPPFYTVFAWERTA